MLQAQDSSSEQEDEKARKELQTTRVVHSSYVSRRVFATAKKTGVPVKFE